MSAQRHPSSAMAHHLIPLLFILFITFLSLSPTTMAQSTNNTANSTQSSNQTSTTTTTPTSYPYFDNVMGSISPPFASWQQSAATPTYLTITYNAPRTFLPSKNESQVLPSIQCVFASTTFCDDPMQFYGDAGIVQGCAYPNAQVTVKGTIISPTQVTCVIPSCPSIASNSSAPGTPATKMTQCTGSYHIAVLVNGNISTNAIEFVYLLPIGAATDNQLPQINSIAPTTIDVNSYVWITLHGANFDLAKTYTNPTLPSNVARNNSSPLQKPDLTLCKIGGILSPLIDTRYTELDATGKKIVRVIHCLSRPRPDLSGSNDNVPVVVEVSINGQEFTANLKVINLFDYDHKSYNNAWTYFFVVVALVGMTFAIMLLQHFLCKNFFRQQQDAEEVSRIRVTKGPQMLIDLLEGQVRAQTAIVRDLDLEEAKEKRAREIAQLEADGKDDTDRVKERIAEIQREAIRKKEEKRREKAERRAAREAAREADRARNEVLAAGGLNVPASEADSTDTEKSEREEREERRRKKKERKAAKEAAVAEPAARVDSQQGGIELASLPVDQLASPSLEVAIGDASSSSQLQPLASPTSKKGRSSRSKSKSKSRSKSYLDVNPSPPPEVDQQPSGGYENDAGQQSERSASGSSRSRSRKKDKKHKKDKKKSSKEKSTIMPLQQEIELQPIASDDVSQPLLNQAPATVRAASSSRSQRGAAVEVAPATVRAASASKSKHDSVLSPEIEQKEFEEAPPQPSDDESAAITSSSASRKKKKKEGKSTKSKKKKKSSTRGDVGEQSEIDTEAEVEVVQAVPASAPAGIMSEVSDVEPADDDDTADAPSRNESTKKKKKSSHKSKKDGKSGKKKKKSSKE